MMGTTGIHAGGEWDFWRAARGPEKECRLRRLLRFTALVNRLCRKKGAFAAFRISAAWRRVKARQPDKSRCLWLGA